MYKSLRIIEGGGRGDSRIRINLSAFCARSSGQREAIFFRGERWWREKKKKMKKNEGLKRRRVGNVEIYISPPDLNKATANAILSPFFFFLSTFSSPFLFHLPSLFFFLRSLSLSLSLSLSSRKVIGNPCKRRALTRINTERSVCFVTRQPGF